MRGWKQGRRYVFGIKAKIVLTLFLMSGSVSMYLSLALGTTKFKQLDKSCFWKEIIEILIFFYYFNYFFGIFP